MEYEQLRALLAALGVHNAVHTHGDWVQCSCALAPFKHKAGRDSNPSCGIALTSPVYNCFVCGAGSLIGLVQEIEMHLQHRPELRPRFDLKLARALLHDDATTVRPLPSFTEFTPGPYREFEAWPEYLVDTFARWHESPRCIKYLKYRRIAGHIADQFDLRYDSGKDMVVAPFRTASGKLAGLRGRLIEFPEDPARRSLRHFDYTWNEVNNIGVVWFNEQTFNLPGPLIVVEGQFDCMRVAHFHPKVAAILSATASEYKKKKLIGAAPLIALLLDNDETGQAQNQKWFEWLTEHKVEAAIIGYPDAETKDPAKGSDAWLAAIQLELFNLN